MSDPVITTVTAAIDSFCHTVDAVPTARYLTVLGQLDRRELAEHLAQLDRIRAQLVDLADGALGRLGDVLGATATSPYADALADVHHAGDISFTTVRELDPSIADSML
ncbi:hypothetical protein ACFORH_43460 [Amycolatopsis roodepoortensis]|uniref:Uncharacterized protein n=1 Tax=Amycolatopsis roodepoortensis TaxID=700274 RepID=A0ABR9LI89_9PSEU|nr:hypothetical protein [Amycolatopsis roodepoortensis]MBE1580399.1 hypothetical protein [Amycolatopsis roodepoortensis]